MTAEAAADLLLELDEEITEGVLARLDEDSEREIRSLLVYPPDSAGGLMSTDIASLPLGSKARPSNESASSTTTTRTSPMSTWLTTPSA